MSGIPVEPRRRSCGRTGQDAEHGSMSAQKGGRPLAGLGRWPQRRSLAAGRPRCRGAGGREWCAALPCNFVCAVSVALLKQSASAWPRGP